MYYVEFLRVFRAMRIYLIILAALFLLAAAMRIGIAPELHHAFMSNFSPTAIRTVRPQADGSVITTIDDSQKGVRVVQRTGRTGWQMSI